MTAVEEAGPGDPPPAEPRGRGNGGPQADGTAASEVSVRSRVSEPPALRTADERLRTAGRAAGREMARRLLKGMGRAEHRMTRCGWRLGESRTFKQDPAGRVRNVGIERCANGRCCPVCGPAQAAVRAAQVGAAVYRWMTSGEDRQAVFCSISASHKATDRLDDLHGQFMAARAAVMDPRHRQWKAFRARFGIVDLAWKVEHNVGPNGPHVGLHAVFLTTRWWDALDAQRAEAWLVLRFREELARAGFTGRMSASYGIDVRPVDDPVSVAKYLAKWGIGREMAAEAEKLGRNGINVPYSAIPAVLALELGHRDPFKVARVDRRVRDLVNAWGDFVRLALEDSGKWWRGFHKLKEYVPELNGKDRPADIIAAATEILPVELQPEQNTDAEAEEDDGTPGRLLEVDGDAWSAAIYRWFRGERAAYYWARRAHRWLGTQDGPPLPLELIVVWLAEDEGLDVAAAVIADLAGAEVEQEDDGRLVVAFPGQSSR